MVLTPYFSYIVTEKTTDLLQVKRQTLSHNVVSSALRHEQVPRLYELLILEYRRRSMIKREKY
jgi:hypothetical protein